VCVTREREQQLADCLGITFIGAHQDYCVHSLPTRGEGYFIELFGPLARPTQPPKVPHRRQQIMVPAPCRKQA